MRASVCFSIYNKSINSNNYSIEEFCCENLSETKKSKKSRKSVEEIVYFCTACVGCVGC
jgi:hypothetical protein